MLWTLILVVSVALGPGDIIGSTTQFFLARVDSETICHDIGGAIARSVPISIGRAKITWSCDGP